MIASESVACRASTLPTILSILQMSNLVILALDFPEALNLFLPLLLSLPSQPNLPTFFLCWGGLPRLILADRSDPSESNRATFLVT